MRTRSTPQSVIRRMRWLGFAALLVAVVSWATVRCTRSTDLLQASAEVCRLCNQLLTAGNACGFSSGTMSIRAGSRFCLTETHGETITAAWSCRAAVRRLAPCAGRRALRWFAERARRIISDRIRTIGAFSNDGPSSSSTVQQKYAARRFFRAPHPIGGTQMNVNVWQRKYLE